MGLFQHSTNVFEGGTKLQIRWRGSLIKDLAVFIASPSPITHTPKKKNYLTGNALSARSKILILDWLPSNVLMYIISVNCNLRYLLKNSQTRSRNCSIIFLLILLMKSSFRARYQRKRKASLPTTKTSFFFLHFEEQGYYSMYFSRFVSAIVPKNTRLISFKRKVKLDFVSGMA